MSLLATAGLVGVPPGSGSGAQTSPGIVVRDFRFLGFGKDVVGQGQDATPDGERDAHFSLVVATPDGPVSVSGLSLWLCYPKQCGDPPKDAASPEFAATHGLSPPRWQQQPPAALAVFRGGQRLQLDARKKGSWLVLPRSAQGVRLDLYVNDGPGCVIGFGGPGHTWPSDLPDTRCAGQKDVPGKDFDHRIAPGQRFRIKVSAAPTAATSGWLSVPGRQKANPIVELSNFRYLGLDKDVTGPTPRSLPGVTDPAPGSAPDGKPDAHFSLDLAPSYGPVDLWIIMFNGTEARPAGWNWAFGGEGLVIFLDGKRWNMQVRWEEACTPPRGGGCRPDPRTWLHLHWSTKPIHVDLYAADTGRGAFTPGPGLGFKFVIGGFVPPSAAGRAESGFASVSLTLPGG